MTATHGSAPPPAIAPLSAQLPAHLPAEHPSWQAIVKRYQQPSVRQSLWQIVNTFVPFVLLWYVSYRSLAISYALPLLFAVIGGLLTLRIFILFHDCGHGSFFKQQRWNDTLGLICSLFVLTPYYHWRHGHALHHASNGDLDRRGMGDVTTLTVEEYQARSPWQQFVYRVYRHPIMLFLLGPFFLFVVWERISEKDAKPRERYNVWWTNAAIGLLATAMCLWVGVVPFLLVQLPITVVASSVGVWLFYVQHQFEDTYWERHDDWEFKDAAIQGSSLYALPKVLQWFSGNIGFHHVHHLSARIPNYKLEQAYKEKPGAPAGDGADAENELGVHAADALGRGARQADQLPAAQRTSGVGDTPNRRDAEHAEDAETKSFLFLRPLCVSAVIGAQFRSTAA